MLSLVVIQLSKLSRQKNNQLVLDQPILNSHSRLQNHIVKNKTDVDELVMHVYLCEDGGEVRVLQTDPSPEPPHTGLLPARHSNCNNTTLQYLAHNFSNIYF